MQATRDTEGIYAFIYFPLNDLSAKLDLSHMRSKRLKGWWFDPRTGVGTLIGDFESASAVEFKSPPYGPDWVLVLEDANAGYPPPGLERFQST